MVLKNEHEKLKEELDSQNIQMAEVQNKQSNLESAIIDAEELLASLQIELNNYENELKQQTEDIEEDISSKLDNVKELKVNYKELYDTNTFLKQVCMFLCFFDSFTIKIFSFRNV